LHFHISGMEARSVACGADAASDNLGLPLTAVIINEYADGGKLPVALESSTEGLLRTAVVCDIIFDESKT
jgi:hypothetical protein